MTDSECALGMKQTIFEWSEGSDHAAKISLGEEIAQCPQKRKHEDFDPVRGEKASYDLGICRFGCWVYRQNQDLRKYALKILETRERSALRVEERQAIKDGRKSRAIRDGDMV